MSRDFVIRLPDTREMRDVLAMFAQHAVEDDVEWLDGEASDEREWAKRARADGREQSALEHEAEAAKYERLSKAYAVFGEVVMRVIYPEAFED